VAETGTLRPGLNFAPEPAHVVGNLPYYISSDILLRLLESTVTFSSIVIMGAEGSRGPSWRPLAGSRDYGLLRRRLAQLYASVERLFTLPAGGIRSTSQSTLQRGSYDGRARLESLAGSEAEFISFLKLSFGQNARRSGTI